MEEICLTESKISDFKRIVEFAQNVKKRHFQVGGHQYQLVIDCSEPPTNIQNKRFVFVGIESLRRGQARFFHCPSCSYSLRNGPGSACVKKIEHSFLKTVFCGQIGNKLVFYVEKT